MSRRQGTFPHATPGTVEPLQWHTVKVVLRGQRTRIEVDDQQVFDCVDDFSQKGFVGLRFFAGEGRFRKINVTAPDRTLLWEGLPDLQ